MKKWTALLLALLALLLLTASGCGPKDEGPRWWDDLEGDEEALARKAYSGEVNGLDGVTLTLKKANGKGGTFTALNTTSKDIQYGAAFRVQRLVDGYWIPAPEKSGANNWALAAYILPRDEEKKLEFDWSLLYDVPLPSGTYRAVMTFMDYRGPGDYTNYDLAAEFEVK